MELFIAPSVGVGDGILAEPAIELRVTEELQAFDLTGKIIARESADHAAEAKIEYNWTEQVRFHAKYESTPGEFKYGLNRTDTVHFGAEIDFAAVTLTADFSPDAFGAGRRSRFGVKSQYEFTDRITAGVHARVRYLSDQDDWEPQTHAHVTYKLNPKASVSLNQVQHDFFDDATILKYTYQAF
jgi:hypothetical protein